MRINADVIERLARTFSDCCSDSVTRTLADYCRRVGEFRDCGCRRVRRSLTT